MLDAHSHDVLRADEGVDQANDGLREEREALHRRAVGEQLGREDRLARAEEPVPELGRRREARGRRDRREARRVRRLERLDERQDLGAVEEPRRDRAPRVDVAPERHRPRLGPRRALARLAVSIHERRRDEQQKRRAHDRRPRAAGAGGEEVEVDGDVLECAFGIVVLKKQVDRVERHERAGAGPDARAHDGAERRGRRALAVFGGFDEPAELGLVAHVDIS
mmetsp:Transcript_12531/g.50374  ORF Transcript_12531/g.50374 Transcript_12531/m.50374 type:complete len:222 (-) Transcript_12531:521-1186(-)